jgi:hypothetical protein
MRRHILHLQLALLIALVVFTITSQPAKACHHSYDGPEDVNGDGVVDIKDLAIVAAAFGSYPGHDRWNPKADINKDGEVDVSDVIAVCLKFGAS